MTDSTWNMVIEPEGLIISNDKFKLVTTGDDPMQMDEIISGLQAMTRRTYGQYCGLSRALEMVGERWGLLLIRDLLVEPKDIADLRSGFPMIPEDLLPIRLKELERGGVVNHREDGKYELTEYGLALEDIVLALGRWGAMQLNQMHPEEIVTVNALVIGLRATFQPEVAKGEHISYEIRVGDTILHALVDDGQLRSRPGPLPDADLILEPGLMLKALLNGELTPADALAGGAVKITGDPALLDRFVDIFHLPKLPTPAKDLIRSQP